MKSLFVILFQLIVFTGISFAQKGVYVRSYGSVAVPFLEIASKSWSSEISCGGFAKLGYHAGLEGQFMFSNSFGLVLGGNVFDFGLDHQSIEKKSINSSTDSNVRAETGSWLFRFISFGPLYKFSISEKWSFDVALASSYYTIHYPYLRRIITNKQGIPSTFTRETPSAKSFGVSADASLIRYLNENLMFSLSAGLFYTQPEFEFTDLSKKKYTALALHSGIGLIYKF